MKSNLERLGEFLHSKLQGRGGLVPLSSLNTDPEFKSLFDNFLQPEDTVKFSDLSLRITVGSYPRTLEDVLFCRYDHEILLCSELAKLNTIHFRNPDATFDEDLIKRAKEELRESIRHVLPGSWE